MTLFVFWGHILSVIPWHRELVIVNSLSLGLYQQITRTVGDGIKRGCLVILA